MCSFICAYVHVCLPVCDCARLCVCGWTCWGALLSQPWCWAGCIASQAAASPQLHKHWSQLPPQAGWSSVALLLVGRDIKGEGFVLPSAWLPAGLKCQVTHTTRQGSALGFPCLRPSSGLSWDSESFGGTRAASPVLIQAEPGGWPRAGFRLQTGPDGPHEAVELRSEGPVTVKSQESNGPLELTCLGAGT